MKSTGYPLPHDIEVEQSILGRTICPIYEWETIDALTKTAEPEDFYKEAHKKIYFTMLQLMNKGSEIDLITLRDKLEDLGALEEIGGSSYLSYLVVVSR